MFGSKSYSERALRLAAAALSVVDEKIEADLRNYGPREVPLNTDWQFKGFFDIFSPSKKTSAEKRLSFNIGLMNGIASIHFDGNARDFDYFLKDAIKIGVVGGSGLLKSLGVLDRKHTKLFLLGLKYSEEFAARHLNDLNIDSSNSQSAKESLSEGKSVQAQNRAAERERLFTVPVSLVKEIGELQKILGGGSVYRSKFALHHHFKESETQRYSTYKLWAEAEIKQRDLVSAAVKTFHRNNLILNQSPSADLFKPIEYSIDDAIFSKSPEEIEEYFQKRELLYKEVQPDFWYRAIAQDYISSTIEFLKQLHFFLLRFGGADSALNVSISFKSTSSKEGITLSSLQELIKKLNDARYSGEFNITIKPHISGVTEYVDIDGWVLHDYSTRDADGTLEAPSGLNFYWFGKRKVSPSFYNFIFEFNPDFVKFLPNASTEVIYDRPPDFLSFAIIFESLVDCVHSSYFQQASFLARNFSALGASRGAGRFSMEVQNTSDLLCIQGIDVVLTGTFPDGHRFSEIVSSCNLNVCGKTKRVVDFSVTNSACLSGYEVDGCVVVDVQLSDA